jgi:hypothetical protein
MNFSADDHLAESLTIANIRKGQNLSNSKFPFLWKLHEMLDDCEKTGDDHIVSWMDEGRRFRVHKPKSFMEKIVPHYFKQSKYKSFQRQLHLYDMVRTPRGIFTGAYSHPLFIRGKKSLCLSLSPHKIKGEGRENQPLHTASLEPPQSVQEILPFPRKRVRDEETEFENEAAPSTKRINIYSALSVGKTEPKMTLNWSAIQNILVTGASLAAELEAKKEKEATNGGPPTGTPTMGLCPHTGDVVFAFDAKPFRFVDDVCVEDEVLDDFIMEALEKDDVMDMLNDSISGEV